MDNFFFFSRVKPELYLKEHQNNKGTF